MFFLRWWPDYAMRMKPLHYETDAATVRREISFLLFSVFGSSYSPGRVIKGGQWCSVHTFLPSRSLKFAPTEFFCCNETRQSIAHERRFKGFVTGWKYSCDSTINRKMTSYEALTSYDVLISHSDSRLDNFIRLLLNGPLESHWIRGLKLTSKFRAVQFWVNWKKWQQNQNVVRQFQAAQCGLVVSKEKRRINENIFLKLNRISWRRNLLLVIKRRIKSLWDEMKLEWTPSQPITIFNTKFAPTIIATLFSCIFIKHNETIKPRFFPPIIFLPNCRTHLLGISFKTQG